MKGKFVVFCLAAWLAAFSSQSFAVATESQKRLRESVTEFASRLLDKSTDQSVTAEVKSFIMGQLQDEWREMKRRSLTREQAFDGQSLLEELVNTSLSLPSEQQYQLNTTMAPDLTELIGTRPGGGGSTGGGQPQPEAQCDTFWDKLTNPACWGGGGSQQSPKNDTNADNRWLGAKELIDQLAI